MLVDGTCLSTSKTFMIYVRVYCQSIKLTWLYDDGISAKVFVFPFFRFRSLLRTSRIHVLIIIIIMQVFDCCYATWLPVTTGVKNARHFTILTVKCSSNSIKRSRELHSLQKQAYRRLETWLWTLSNGQQPWWPNNITSRLATCVCLYGSRQRNHGFSLLWIIIIFVYWKLTNRN